MYSHPGTSKVDNYQCAYTQNSPPTVLFTGKSKTGDDNTMPHVLGNRPEKKERAKRNEHIEMQKGANFTVGSFYTRA